MLLGTYTHEEFLVAAKEFHGYPAPGLIIGAYMTELARERVQPMLEDHGLFNAISETGQCLPDAIQMLTPCTVGNGWLKICDNGRYAMSLFNKYTGQGVRVYLDLNKLDAYPTIKEWLMKLRPKREQNTALLQEEIKQAKTSILTVQEIQTKEEYYGKHGKGGISTCALCGESIPARNGIICAHCAGDTPYIYADDSPPVLRAVALEDAIGKTALHDMTRITPKEFKGVQVKAGHVINAGDMCDLQRIGKNNIYVVEDVATQKDNVNEPDQGVNENTFVSTPPPPLHAGSESSRNPSHNSKSINFVPQDIAGKYLHENDCAARLACMLGGQFVSPVAQIREGKISFIAKEDGLLWLEEKRLEAFNTLGNVIAVTRKQATLVKKGEVVASSRAIPLYLTKQQWLRVENIIRNAPLFSVLPIPAHKVGLLITGSEVFNGIIEDKFAPILKAKLEEFSCDVIDTVFCPDDSDELVTRVNTLREKGVELIITSAGLSVDPDDVTRKGLIEAGLCNSLYGMSILPGAMSLVGSFAKTDIFDTCKVIGVPACALFHHRTAFDVLLPLVLSNAPLNREFFALRANGGLCEECSNCTYPKCRFAV